MNELDDLIRTVVDDSIDRARPTTRTAALPSRRRRPIVGRLAAATVVALGFVAMVAWSPWSGDGRHETRRVLPSIETASAKDVLGQVASRVVDEGNGRWLYVRTSSWNLDHRVFQGAVCSTKCVYYGTGPDGERVPIDIATIPYVRAAMTEWWSDGAGQLARRQYSSYVSAGTKACLDPSGSIRCLGWEHRMLEQIDPPHPFPKDADAGRAALERLARQRNEATRRAMATGRFPTNGAALTAGEIGMRLLTGPVYDARNRARVIRALGELPGATNAGSATDAKGRRGIEIHLPAQRVAFPKRPGAVRYRTWIKPPANRPRIMPREIVAIFDVDEGLLLQYHVTNEFGGFGMQEPARPWNYTVVDVQERQSSPKPTDDVVEAIPRPDALSVVPAVVEPD